MEIEQQFTAFLQNKPGRLSNICAALAKRRINIIALTVMDSKEHSVLRIVADNAEDTREVLKKMSIPFDESEVFVVELRNQPGALAHLCELLANHHVNVDYMYCSSGKKNGKTSAILKATPTQKVKTLLAEHKEEKAERNPQRRPPVRR